MCSSIPRASWPQWSGDLRLFRNTIENLVCECGFSSDLTSHLGLIPLFFGTYLCYFGIMAYMLPDQSQWFARFISLALSSKYTLHWNWRISLLFGVQGARTWTTSLPWDPLRVPTKFANNSWLAFFSTRCFVRCEKFVVFAEDKKFGVQNETWLHYGRAILLQLAGFLSLCVFCRLCFDQLNG